MIKKHLNSFITLYFFYRKFRSKNSTVRMRWVPFCCFMKTMATILSLNSYFFPISLREVLHSQPDGAFISIRCAKRQGENILIGSLF